MLNIILFLVILTVIVTVHEFGHFYFAKKAGIYCHEFSIGMGPKLYSKKYKGTTFSIRALPIGGFVSMAGEGGEFEVDLVESDFFNSKTLLQRFLSIVAGPVFNLILAIFLYFIIGMINGVSTNVVNISENSIASSYGLVDGTKIVAVNNHKTSLYNEVNQAIGMDKAFDDGKVLFKVESENQIQEIEVDFSKEGTLFGIKSTKSKDFLTVIKYPFQETKFVVSQVFVSLKLLVTQKASVKDMSGPVGIFKLTDNTVNEAAKTGVGAVILSILSITAFLSINIGVFNLLPFPALDGGRIVFLGYEFIFRKPVSKKFENYFHTIGFILLIGLMIMVTYNDIIKLIFK